ncbi:MAG: hypothetical protein GYA58_11230 [Anaerolineaceae bacterium]|jgi:hypothetical protein|nr:hypothetical protein [Anaerolineaceae bacterium]
MVQEGKITPEMAAELLKALDASAHPGAGKDTESSGETIPGMTGRYFRVRVSDINSGKVRANIRLPLGMVNAGLRMGMKFSPEVEGLNAERLAEALANGKTGKIVDVYDDEDGEHVEVFIE